MNYTLKHHFSHERVLKPNQTKPLHTKTNLQGDLGNYSCEARNNQGESSARIEISGIVIELSSENIAKIGLQNNSYCNIINYRLSQPERVLQSAWRRRTRGHPEVLRGRDTGAYHHLGEEGDDHFVQVYFLKEDLRALLRLPKK